MAEITIKQIEVLVAKVYDSAMNEYADILAGIANDIYDSCINQYYASYTPKVYKRHGKIEGFNLYRANGFMVDNNGVISDFDGGNPDALLKYGAKRDIRAEILEAVLSGKRGITSRPSPPAENKWPMSWIASYPNEYSQYHYWSSHYHTMEEIIADFENNILDDTRDLKKKLIHKHIKKHTG